MNDYHNLSNEGFIVRPLDLQIEHLQVHLSIVNNPGELLERLLAKGSDHEDVRDERIPYWAELWPAAIALSRHLIQKKLVRPDTPALEIGCGLGLAGIVAGLLGAEVTLSDYLPDALEFARLNWAHNLGRPARFEILDWRNPDPAMAAPLILAADVAYEKRAFPALPKAFRTLCQPGGLILAADPCRSSAHEFFGHILPEAGFEVRPFSYEELYNGHTFKIYVYEIRKLA
ncbi:MAG: hypothetical protein RL386_1456 [Bacteroidota bacterium]|jgi:predicted nicotinamide N-methyase